MQSLAALTPQRNLKLDDILDGIAQWPGDAKDHDGLYLLAQSLHGRLVEDNPGRETVADGEQPNFLRRRPRQPALPRGVHPAKAGPTRR